jgi:hypothetical protein
MWKKFRKKSDFMFHTNANFQCEPIDKIFEAEIENEKQNKIEKLKEENFISNNGGMIGVKNQTVSETLNNDIMNIITSLSQRVTKLEAENIVLKNKLFANSDESVKKQSKKICPSV